MLRSLFVLTTVMGLVCFCSVNCNGTGDNGTDGGPDGDTDSDTDADSDSDTDTDADSDTDTDTDSDTDTDTDTDSDTDSDADECLPPLIYHPAVDDCVSTKGLHDDCKDDVKSCQTGQECVEFLGFAGNPFYNCEIECGPRPERLCPADFVCVDVSDGPSNVCWERE